MNEQKQVPARGEPVMKQHRSTRIANSCLVTVDPNDYNANHAAILEYNERVRMIDKLGWADHTSDWDLGTTITLQDGAAVQTTQGDPYLEWGIEAECLDLLEYISKIQTHVTIVIFGTDEEANLYREMGLLITAPIHTPEYDHDGDEFEYRRVSIPVERIYSMSLYY